MQPDAVVPADIPATGVPKRPKRLVVIVIINIAVALISVVAIVAFYSLVPRFPRKWFPAMPVRHWPWLLLSQ